MQAQELLMAIAQIAVALAGFSGLIAPNIHDSDHTSRGCHPSGAAVRIAAMRPEKPASATAICAIAMSNSCACTVRPPRNEALRPPLL